MTTEHPEEPTAPLAPATPMRVAVTEYPLALRPSRWRCPLASCTKPIAFVLTDDDGYMQFECEAGHITAPRPCDYYGDDGAPITNVEYFTEAAQRSLEAANQEALAQRTPPRVLGRIAQVTPTTLTVDNPPPETPAEPAPPTEAEQLVALRAQVQSLGELIVRTFQFEKLTLSGDTWLLVRGDGKGNTETMRLDAQLASGLRFSRSAQMKGFTLLQQRRIQDWRRETFVEAALWRGSLIPSPHRDAAPFAVSGDRIVLESKRRYRFGAQPVADDTTTSTGPEYDLAGVARIYCAPSEVVIELARLGRDAAAAYAAHSGRQPLDAFRRALVDFLAGRLDSQQVEDLAQVACPAPESFEEELTRALNKWNMEEASNTPDHILAGYLMHCLAAFAATSQAREQWYGVELRPAQHRTPDIWNSAPDLLARREAAIDLGTTYWQEILSGATVEHTPKLIAAVARMSLAHPDAEIPASLTRLDALIDADVLGDRGSVEL